MARSHGGVKVEAELIERWAILIVARVQNSDGRGRQGGAQEEEAQLGEPARQVMRSSVAMADDRLARVDNGIFSSSHRDDVHVGKVQQVRSGVPGSRVLACPWLLGSASQAFLVSILFWFLPVFINDWRFGTAKAIKKGNGKGKAVQVLSVNDKKKTAGPRPAACMCSLGTDS